MYQLTIINITLLLFVQLKIQIFYVITNNNTLYVDGTFENFLKIFMQMFKIHTIHNNHYIPLIFCLLKNKHKDVYTQMFRTLCNEFDKLNYLKFLPQKMYVDFEEAIHYSILSVWLKTNIKGDRAHLGES